MESFLQHIWENLRNQGPQRIVLSKEDAETETRWGDDDPGVAVEHLIDAFRRHGEYVGELVMLPVHEPDSPTLTGEYVGYWENDYGKALYYTGAESGIEEYLNLEDASKSGLAYRLRFWDRRWDLPSGTTDGYIDDRPPNRPEPLTANNPLTDHEVDQYIQDTYNFVRVELLQSHKDSLEKLLERELEVTNPGNGKVSTAYPTFMPPLVNCKVHLSQSPTRPGQTQTIEEEYGVYEGNTIVLFWDNGTDNYAYLDGKVVGTNGSTIQVDTDFGVIDHSTVSTGDVEEVSIRVVERGIAETREREAFEKLARRHKNLLAGNRELTFSSPLNEEFDPILDLNTYQEQAAVDAIRADDVFCIHGPPGTGKTRTLVSIVAHAVQYDQRVLVCAHSNQAVDNIVVGESSQTDVDAASLHNVVEMLTEQDVKMGRVGSSRGRVADLVEDIYYLPTDAPDEDYEGLDIIATTTNTAAALDNSRVGTLDLVVADEATQASAPATAVPFGRGRRVVRDPKTNRPIRLGNRTVLAGDHKQLSPYVANEQMRTDELHKSLFEHLITVYGDDLAQTLHRQYRMHEDIAEFASQEFYNGELEHGEENRSATIDGLDPLLVIDASGGEKTTDDHSKYNPTEAGYVVAQIHKALESDVKPSDIGVITGYSGQRDEIRRQLKNQFERSVVTDIDVETIDKFQGGQREVIIVSFTRSNDENNSGFLEHPPEDGKKRLNVAMTRAKKRLVLIGDFDTLASPADHLTVDESCADSYARLRNYLEAKAVVVSQ